MTEALVKDITIHHRFAPDEHVLLVKEKPDHTLIVTNRALYRRIDEPAKEGNQE